MNQLREKENIEKHDLTKGDVWKKLWAYFLPMAIGAIVQQLYNTADALIVSKYVGKVALAAISGSVSQILNLMVGTFIALTSGAAVYIAQLYGIGDKLRIKKAITTSIYICSFIGIIVSVLGLIYSRTMLIWLKTPDDTLDEADIYLKWCFAAAVFVMIYNIGAGIVRASGDSTKPFIYLLCCSLTNIALDYVFVKIFSMGVRGAAVATAFAQFVSALLVVIELFKTKDAHRFEPSFKYFSLTALKTSMKYGIPTAVQQIVSGVSNTTIQVALNLLGTTAVAAWSLTGKVDGLYWSVIMSCGTAVMNFAGQNYGAGRLDRIKESTKKSLIYFMIFTVSICVVLISFGEPLFKFFLDDEETCVLAYKMMVICASGYPLWTLTEIFTGVLKGCGDVVMPTMYCVVGIAGIRLTWLYTVYRIYPNAYVLALSYVASWAVTAIALTIRYFRGGWKKKKVIE